MHQFMLTAGEECREEEIVERAAEILRHLVYEGFQRGLRRNADRANPRRNLTMLGKPQLVNL